MCQHEKLVLIALVSSEGSDKYMHACSMNVDECSRLQFRQLAKLDTSARAFIRGFCAYATSTKILCAGPYASNWNTSGLG